MEHMTLQKKKKKKNDLRFFSLPHTGLVTLFLIEITEQGFVENSAYEQLSLIGSCYTGGCDHTAIICVLLAHQRSLWMDVLYPDDLKGNGIIYAENSTLQHQSQPYLSATHAWHTA